jgi:hypothetical protein
MIGRISTPAERALATEIATAVQRGDAATIWKRGSPGLKNHLGSTTIARMHALAPQEKPTLVDAKAMWQAINGVTTEWKQFTFETGSGARWAVIQVVLRESNGTATVDSVFIQPADRAPSAINAFTFEGKSGVHYLWLAAMAAALIVSLTAFGLVVLTRGLRLKWLWAVGVLFSFVTFSLNWTDGEWAIQPISFLLLGAAGMQAGRLAPWIFSFAIPVPAILFLILRATGKLPMRRDDPARSRNDAPAVVVDAAKNAAGSDAPEHGL